MIFTLGIREVSYLGVCLALAIVMWGATGVYAQSSAQALSVTPPLFQLSVAPGSAWQSAVRVVNPNPFPLTVYAEVANFAATGEYGQGRFIPIEGDPALQKTLAEWIDINRGPHTIEPEQSKELPFIINVPEAAPPGGHYAAILISTQPAQSEEKLLVQTVQSVTSLFFLRIEGDVVEEGTIREFRALDSVVNTPDVTLSLRFENKGNVHLQPRGDIVITNMWGTERGRIPVNYRSNFGNVLPSTIRDFTFAWRTDFKITDIGRYTALTTLGYGENGVKSVDAVTHFWVIPIKATVITLLVLTCFIIALTLMVRAYIRHVLTLAGVSVHGRDDRGGNPMRMTYGRATAPIAHGVLDLRTRLDAVETPASRMRALREFIVQYRRFFASLALLVFIVMCSVWFILSATRDNQHYEVEILDSSLPSGE